MRTDFFDYDLPQNAIAQTPIEPRHAARMLVDLGVAGGIEHRTVADLDHLLEPRDVLVVNNTKVLAARLNLFKPTGGAVEVLLLEPTGNGDEWQALVRPSRRVADGTKLELHGRPVVTVGAPVGDGRRLVTIDSAAIDEHGEVPLPPYITEPLADPDRYQTVFADRIGSVAAPTAGLHLSEEVLQRLADRGVAVETIELFVGLATFRPISTDRIDDHEMHHERYRVDPAVWERLIEARDRGGRLVAVGTTVVRTLESAAITGELEGSTDLFIRRGHEWRMVDVLLTNFHVPRSSLLVLVDAFIGERWRELYVTALAEGYRFLSFGDCMLLVRRTEPRRTEIA
ncbi:MAG: tRNA preQ1(34) S-adenosylmethionine ribosyltransferase-isomerase QueA [Acidimicrobiia bacterium]|nr:tRNA preQ1(34) S-adenosylmethionine ribosyltransferase-isomerase QueA [Acidimicrobiia bacterium]MDH5519736.1 tRNA preQ1(34) S-adenosylmethionine ribosyltransferase-isomerase QueA [Acidimicrobiia bacterium]